MRDQHLAITADTGTDTDSWNGQPLGDQFSQPCRNRFEHQAETACFLQDQRIFEQSFGSRGIAPLRAVPAQLMHGLRRQAQVPHNRDAGADNGFDCFGALAPAFQFDRVHASFLQEASGITHGLLDRDLVGHKRHIPD